MKVYRKKNIVKCYLLRKKKKRKEKESKLGTRYLYTTNWCIFFTNIAYDRNFFFNIV